MKYIDSLLATKFTVLDIITLPSKKIIIDLSPFLKVIELECGAWTYIVLGAPGVNELIAAYTVANGFIIEPFPVESLPDVEFTCNEA